MGLINFDEGLGQGVIKIPLWLMLRLADHVYSLIEQQGKLEP